MSVSMIPLFGKIETSPGRPQRQHRASRNASNGPRKEALPKRAFQDQPGFLNRGLDLRLVPREVKALLAIRDVRAISRVVDTLPHFLVGEPEFWVG